MSYILLSFLPVHIASFAFVGLLVGFATSAPKLDMCSIRDVDAFPSIECTVLKGCLGVSPDVEVLQVEGVVRFGDWKIHFVSRALLFALSLSQGIPS